MIRIVLAGDQMAVRQLLQSHLDPEPDLEVVGMAEQGRQAIVKVALLRPDILLLDLEMPDMDGLQVAKTIRQRFPETKVLILTSQGDLTHLIQALQIGVQGYLLRTTSAEELVTAIRSVDKGYLQLGRELVEQYVVDRAVVSPQKMGRTPLSLQPPNGASTKLGASPVAVISTNAVSTGIQSLQNGQNAGTAKSLAVPRFDRPVILQQSPVWSRGILWGIVGCTTAALAWACFFQIEEAIPAAGQLEPQGSVKEVQSPVPGVVQTISVQEGQRVKKGDVLLHLNPKATQSELVSSQQIRQQLKQENEFYRRQLQGDTSTKIALDLPPKLATLTRNRQALIAENQLYRSQLNGTGDLRKFTLEERQRLRSGQLQEASSMSAAQAQVSQSQEQLKQIATQMEQTQIQLVSAQQTLGLNQENLEDIQEAYEKGAITRVQYKSQQDKVQLGEAAVARLAKEQVRLSQQMAQVRQEIAQAEAQTQNTVANNQKDLLDRIAENEKRIDDIDSQLTKAIVENDKQIAELDNRLNQARLTMQFQELRAPVDGVVFDLKPRAPGYVANTSEPILKIVPTDALLAKVFITNRDIGFVKPGMSVDVRVDSFPLSEFGDIKGNLEWIGSDALPPTEVRPFYSFPARVKLQAQTLQVSGRRLPLQSGMSISVNIKVRQRPVISLVTDLLTREAENIKHLR
jgi:HlyD family secretion protein